MTMDELVANIPLDSKHYNRDRMCMGIAWEAARGAGYSLKLDPAIVHDRLLEMAEACKVAADWVKPQIVKEDL